MYSVSPYFPFVYCMDRSISIATSYWYFFPAVLQSLFGSTVASLCLWLLPCFHLSFNPAASELSVSLKYALLPQSGAACNLYIAVSFLHRHAPDNLTQLFHSASKCGAAECTAFLVLKDIILRLSPFLFDIYLH